MTSEPKSLSVWDYKPWWCQPWSIVLTGIVLISGSWLVFQTVWITVLVAVPLLVWMGFFLLLYPKLVQDELNAYANRQTAIDPGDGTM
ncbi:hypothetical protein IQ268_24175 [Oculatella sp. LEGE 06141]|uniref:DUF6737 family protein n=1 Tax=Oculatella sp. LEGE 06141 TaxID=1828648 RepID=UPI001883037B|nr:DUF6737 family protein [Oculatella sp. LEGE 06141]MBE9181666.1 hypothetical protein [Oculatella sp. LEGE 06141]